MADVAKGANCPVCGTLITCSGSFADANLAGTCPVDGTTLTVPNVLVNLGVFVSASSLPLTVAIQDAAEPAATEFGA